MPLPRLSGVKSKLKEVAAKIAALAVGLIKKLAAHIRSSEDAKKRILLGGILLVFMLTSLILFISLRGGSSREGDFGIPDDFGILSLKTSVSPGSPLAPGVHAWRSGFPWRALDLFEEALRENLSQRERIALFNYCGHIRIALGDYAQASTAFNNARRLAPDAGAEYGLGRIAQLTHDIPQALQFYARATALRGDFALAWRRQGDCHFGLNRYAEARTKYRRALTHSDEDLIRFRLAECALHLGELEEARSGFLFLLENAQHPNIIAFSAAHLADSECDKGNTSAAIAYYRQAIRANPNVSAFRFNLGGLHLLAGELDEAVAVYNALLAMPRGLESDDANRRLAGILSRSLGEVFYDRNDSESALRFLQGSGQEDQEVLSMLGDINFLRGEDDLALEYYRRVLALGPLSRLAFLAYANSGTIYMNRSQAARALAAYTKALEIEPENPQLHYNLGFALLETGDRQGAQAAFLQAYTADQSLTDALLALVVTAGPENAVSVLFQARDESGHDSFFTQSLLARVFHLARDYGRAITSARRALVLAPAGTPVFDIQLLLLRSLLVQEEYSGAAKLLRDLRESHSQDPIYLYCAALFALRAGDSAAAARYLDLARQFVRSPSLRAAISYWQGNLAWQEGRIADALERYRETLDLVPGHTAASYNASYCVRQLADGNRGTR
jgi:tetratricopeptide (TPR) repeat protein